MQNTDRLQQLVALQTEMGLERQRCAQDTERLAFLEKETLRLTGELQRTQRDYRSVGENYREAVNRIAKLEADIACAKADGLVLTNRVNALTRELEQKSEELEQTTEMLREHQVQVELQGKQLQTREEEKRVLQKQNEELNRYIQSEEKEKESLQSVITEQEKEIEKQKEQETLLRQEIADFVGYVSFFDFQKNALSLLQETVNQIQEQYERPETHQSNQTLNQLREENRKLMNKVEVRRKDERQLEIARKRMTNYGLSTNDIDVSGDEFVAIRRLEEMLQELKKVCEKSCH